MNSQDFFIDQDNKVFSLSLAKQFPPINVAMPAQVMSGWVASENINFYTATPPTYRKAVLTKTMPFMMEDYLIEPLENYHFTLLIENRRKPVSIFATTHSKMQEWQDLLKAVNLAPTALYPDALALDYDEEAIHAHVSKKRCIARNGEFSGFCGRGDIFFSLLREEAAKLNKEIRIYTDDASKLPKDLKDKVIRDGLEWLDFLKDAPVPNQNTMLSLMHGDYAPEKSGSVLSRIRPSRLAVAAAVLACVILLADLLQLRSSQQQTQDIEDASRLLYSQMFNQEINDISQLRNRVLLNLDELSLPPGDIDNQVWVRLRELSDIMNLCPACNILEFNLRHDSRRSEIIVESNQERLPFEEAFNNLNWRVLSWNTSPVPVAEDVYPVFRTRLILEKSDG